MRRVRALGRRQAPRLVDEPLEVQARDDAQRLEVGELAVVDDLHERAPPVEEPEDAVHLVGNLGEPVDELLVVDLEDGLERRELLEETPPLVEPAHPFHEQALRREVDHVLAPDRLELDLELAVGPDEQAIHRVLALQPAELGVDDLAVPKVDRRAPALAGEVDDAGFSTYFNGLNQVNDRHVGELAGELGLRLALLRQRRALLLLKEDLDPGDDLLDVDRLRQVLLDAELEPADLVLRTSTR